jgi:hypothetical protein
VPREASNLSEVRFGDVAVLKQILVLHRKHLWKFISLTQIWGSTSPPLMHGEFPWWWSSYLQWWCSIAEIEVDLAPPLRMREGADGHPHCHPHCLRQALPRRRWPWYVSNVSIIFDAPCLFLHYLPNVSLHFVAFLCIFWN